MGSSVERLEGQAEIWEHMFAFVDSMALKCAVELGIPDIINSHGRPVTMSEIIDSLKTNTSSSLNADYLTSWIMHDWGDKDCIKILRNCHKAIPKKKNGKVIIVDCVVRPDGDGIFDKTELAFDLLMMAHTSGGKERIEDEWKMLLNNAGFPQYNIIQIPAFPSIIEAFPE
ncbi:(R,S)-reticuline 7-O-methyltransferase-like [Papaver somniferum]|uniref:(R,S)-reticuline 7-O-methyltransferase-like n=1 Tax=Papaver somniferum TaxID=3469 RepID=UPI000E704AB2|nr:(R,S)-reticuline 7-O-methyltransferase-like [Papaver somniferum]